MNKIFRAVDSGDYGDKKIPSADFGKAFSLFNTFEAFNYFALAIVFFILIASSLSLVLEVDSK